ncbi:MAG: DNA-directed RNA polymerase subunit beta' [Patescibacteria group bacterium]|nr:MAG: DNA-directed RNA polymerase subunit beta' [Patescibacteria group bacterium]
MKDFDIMKIAGLKISLASPEKILKWSYGEVTRPETINYRTYRPEKEGLFDERIFGPTKDYECYCGKYKRIKYQGIICDRCGVEVTTSAVRRERMGHIKLAAPVVHIWYFKGVSSPLSLILDISSQVIERVIYFALYLVTDVDEDKKKEVLAKLEEIKKTELEKLEAEKKQVEKKYLDKMEKEKEEIKSRIKNQDQQMIALKEVEFENRKKIKKAIDTIANRVAEMTAFFDRLSKVVKTSKRLSSIEEEDYIYLRDNNLIDFVKVGMGGDVIYDVLKSIDLNQLYDDVLKLHAKAKGDKRQKIAKRLRVIEGLIKANIKPEWMVLTVLPVLPPGLRPVVQLPGGKFATSDLNDFYRRVINRNNRLKQLIELGAPEIILRNEKRMLQESVDQLIDLTKAQGRQTTRRAGIKILKSLSDNLRGKKGRFRQNLLGKRVDYSGRSTIIGGPELKLNECGIPKEMAIELFKPNLTHEIIVRGYAANIKSAKAFIEERHPEVYDILEEVIKDRPVLLNRAPTLHKLSILAFYPKLVDHFAIELHPAVCAGYNADFDGDAMGVFLPLSDEAIKEVKERMFVYKNLLKPSDGSPIVVPNKEMALGIYFITSERIEDQNKQDQDLRVFYSIEDLLKAYEFDKVDLRQLVLVFVSKEYGWMKTTIGRVFFNSIIPAELGFINNEVKAADLKDLVKRAIKVLKDEKRVGQLIDDLKVMGFWGATQAAGLSFSVFDCVIIPEKDQIVKETEQKVNDIRQKYEQGLLTDEERQRYSNNLWLQTTEVLADKTWDALPEENPVKMIIKSGGARGSKEQLKQLSAIKGMVYNPLGKVIEVPTKSNYRQGLSMLEYVIAARGGRKALIDTALKTADAGYLTRRLVDVAHDVLIREEDCAVAEGLVVKAEGDRAESFYRRIHGRFLLKPVLDQNKKTIIPENTLIEEEQIDLIKQHNIKEVEVRSPLYCSSQYGVCQKCYGLDIATNEVVEIGTPVGVLAAQSVGEPGTQLTMRVKHFGGIVISDVTQGLPRVEELFEMRTPKVLAPIAEIDGKVIIHEDIENNVYKINIVGQKDGKEEVQEVIISMTQKLKVKDGQLITAGTSLSEGYLRVQDILSIRGLRAAQIYLLDEIQKVYESQGILIHDKYFEVIIRKMSDKIIIEDEGDTAFIKGEVVSRVRFEEENKRILVQGGKPASGKISILGVTRAAIVTDSWLSAASFQETTNVLSDSALKGKIDYLLGLKENVIIGRPVPVTEELVNNYYKRFLNKYADNKSTDQAREKEEN